MLVIENYATSDGHGHSDKRYLDYAMCKDRAVVVLIYLGHDSSAQTGGWEHATVVTYQARANHLHTELARDHKYWSRHPEASSYIDRLHRKYAQVITRMDDHEVLDFVTVMCTTGEAKRYSHRASED